MMDEGVGVRAVDELKRRFHFPDNVEIIDGGTSGLDLLEYIEGKDHLVLIDAIKGNAAPGSVLIVRGKDVPAQFFTRISPHQLGISDLLATATIIDKLPENVVLFGIEPKTIKMGLTLSTEVKEGFDRLLMAVVDYLRTLGCDIRPLPEDEIAREESIWGVM